jgi:hypothetical protein
MVRSRLWRGWWLGAAAAWGMALFWLGGEVARSRSRARPVPPETLRTTYVGQCDLTLYKNQCCYRATWMSCQMTFPCTNPQQLQCPKDLTSLGTCGAQKTPKGQQCKSQTYANCQAGFFTIPTDVCTYTGNKVQCPDGVTFRCEYRYQPPQPGNPTINVCTCTIGTNLCLTQPNSPCPPP